jgi:hypothetical protein
MKGALPLWIGGSLGFRSLLPALGIPPNWYGICGGSLWHDGVPRSNDTTANDLPVSPSGSNNEQQEDTRYARHE